MRLSHLLQQCFSVPESLDCEIKSLALDSRQVQPQTLFFALKGTHQDGRQFISDAVNRGACAVLIEGDSPNDALTWCEQIPCIPIYQLQQQIGRLAAHFYHEPAEKMRMIGVTGTSGKTSCTHFIAQSLHSLNVPCGIIGTLGSGFYGALGPAGLTTPDALTLQATLAKFAEEGAQAIAMEVSSHSIDQGRIQGIDFDIGIFTNLSQDHLDYHGDMASYAAVKYRFIEASTTRQVIINADDPIGHEWIQALAMKKPVIAYSLKPNPSLPESVPCVFVDRVKPSLQGVRAHVVSPWGEGELLLPLIGQFNLSNSLAVLAALCMYGIQFDQALACLGQLETVPGRMQALGGRGQPLVVVDYAHKPDALEKVLQALRAHTQGKLICVFGCGGERDRGKRPLMAKIAETWADQVIVTNDNPRHEDPEAIIAEIQGGFAHPEGVVIEPDRSKAIKNSIQLASVQDCVLIAGKGAERYQQMGDEKIPFDDVEQVRMGLDLGSTEKS